MSPSEFDLRSALRDGEDDGGLDVERVIADARATRTQRRTRVLSTAAAVVVVAGAAVGGAVLLGGGGSSPNRDVGTRPDATAGGTSTDGPSPVGTPEPNRVATGGTSEPGSASSVTTSCPTSFPRTLLPGGGSPGQFGSGGKMFAQPVSSVVVCGYGSTVSGDGVSAAPLVLRGANATTLVDSIENASRSRLAIACPDIAVQNQTELAIIGITAGGTALPTVTTETTVPNCNRPITNGTAVRYAWQPPAHIATILKALTPATLTPGTLTPGTRVPATLARTPASGSGQKNGSPVR